MSGTTDPLDDRIKIQAISAASEDRNGGRRAPREILGCILEAVRSYLELGESGGN